MLMFMLNVTHCCTVLYNTCTVVHWGTTHFVVLREITFCWEEVVMKRTIKDRVGLYKVLLSLDQESFSRRQTAAKKAGLYQSVVVGHWGNRSDAFV